jgi:hypothetical protein
VTSTGVRADIAALAVLWLTAAVIAVPILLGGWSSYLDNPVHLAELEEMARPDFSGWSDVGLCGLPLANLHSPLWFGLLAVLHRWGLPLGLLYSGALLVAFAAPATVLYRLARRHVGAAPSCAIAYLLLIQYPTLFGASSALGGMWTFYLAGAFLLLLLDSLARPTRDLAHALRIAALTGLVGLTHSFFFAVLGLAAVVHFALALPRRERWLLLRWDALAMAVGLVAASAYWLPLVLVRGWLRPVTTNLSAIYVLKLLCLPIDLLQLRQDNALGWSDLPHAIPIVSLVLLGLLGTVLLLLRRREPHGAIPSALLLGWVVLFLLLVLFPKTQWQWLGPLSFRLLYISRMGFALAAIVVLSRWRLPWRPQSCIPLALAAVLAVALGAVWGQPLGRVVPMPADREVVDTQRLWRWLGENHKPGWGRVLVQDTFFSVGPDSVLGWSHLLARTAAEAGVEQVGPYYSALPFPTDAWAVTEFSRLLGVKLVDGQALQRLKVRMAAVDATHVVLCQPGAIAQVRGDPDFTVLHRIGDFAIYRFRDGRSRPAVSVAPIAVRVERLRPGHLIVHADSAVPGELILAEAYHPFWRMWSTAGVTLTQADVGLMKLHVPAGRHEVELEYVSPVLPRLLSASAWALLGLVWLATRIRRRVSTRAWKPGRESPA